MTENFPNIVLILLALSLKVIAIYGVYCSISAFSLHDSVARIVCSWLIVTAGWIAFALLLSISNSLNSAAAWSYWLIAASVATPFIVRLRARPQIRMVYFLTLPFLAYLIFVFLRAVFLTDFTWDAQTYAFARISIWMNGGSLLTHYPTLMLNLFVNEWSAELIALSYGLQVGSIQGFMFLGVEVVLLLFLAVFWLSLNLGASSAISISVATLICTLPASMGLAAVIKGDLLAVVGLVFAAAAFTKLDRNPSFYSFVGSASLALALGSKISVAFGVASLAVLSVASVSRTNLRSVLIGATFGSFLGLFFLSRYVLNSVLYGRPFVRIPGEDPQLGLTTLTDSAQLIVARSLQFSPSGPDGIAYGTLLFAGLGVALVGIVGSLIVRIFSQKGLSSRDLSLISVSFFTILTTGAILPTYDWSFRYYLPVLIIIIVVLIAFCMRSKFARAFLCLLYLGVSVTNIWYLTWPGEPNGNTNLYAVWAALPSMSAVDRAAFSQKLYAAYGMDQFDYDSEAGQTFVIFAAVDRPLSPFVGSKAQNRLILEDTVSGMVHAAHRVCADFMVVTLPQNTSLIAEDLEKIRNSAYKIILKNDQVIVSSRRDICRSEIES